MLFDAKKYQAAFLHLLHAIGKIEEKKKICLLFYFLDFDYYEAYETSFTGETYIASVTGPYPEHFELLIHGMQAEEPLQSTTWTKQEHAMLDHIVDKYGALSAQELEQLACREAPYCAVDMHEIIPYEFSFYRGTRS
jgi:hypothetical protein